MNLIHTLPCGCHRGLCECPEATDLHTAMNTAYTQTDTIPTLFDEEHREAWHTYEQCRNAYTTHIEQHQEQDNG